jgi:hypothetical protein
MGRRRLLLVVLLLALIAGVWWARRSPVRYPEAYIADRSAALWSATAQVRRQVATLGYGEKVSVLGRTADLTEVRSADGTHGWIDSRLLMAPELWSRVGQLLSDARNMPVQAWGHTRTVSNVHIEPGRDSARIFQFGRNVPVAVLQRQVAAVPTTTSSDEGRSGDEAPPPGDEKSAEEDWALVMFSQAKASAAASASGSAGAQADTGRSVPIAGWVLARFIELDPPAPIGDYTAAAGRKVAAWVQLNTVADASGEKPQYMVAATKGGEGQPCDFTSVRVYTWGVEHKRYETSFVDNNLCGRLPVRVTQTPAGPEFRFSDDKSVEHAYRLMQTVVRRIGPPVPARGQRNRTAPR